MIETPAAFMERVRHGRAYVIAEVGINHDGSLERAEQLIEQAVACGADAVKFQTFRTERLVRAAEPKMPYQVQSSGGAESQYAMLKRVELGWDAHVRLRDFARARASDFISTPYETESADLLVKLGVPVIKIASTDTTNVPFLRYIDGLGKAVILSSGVTELWELARALEAFGPAGRARLALLHCVSNYPAPLEEINLACLRQLAAAFRCPVGFSDHTDDVDVGAFAVAAGARILEKHLTYDRDAAGPDHRASLTAGGMARYIANVRKAERCLGDGEKRVTASERPVKTRMQKSLVAARPLDAGTVICGSDLGEMRPATGISPLFVDAVIGRRLRTSKAAQEELRWSDLADA
jgi:sialic acid synthase SpsE